MNLEVGNDEFLMAHGGSRFVQPNKMMEMKRKAKIGAQCLLFSFAKYVVVCSRFISRHTWLSFRVFAVQAVVRESVFHCVPMVNLENLLAKHGFNKDPIWNANNAHTWTIDHSLDH